MTFIEAVRLIASRAGQELDQTTQNSQTVETLLKVMLNLRLQDFMTRRRWFWNEKTTTFQTIPNYITGTMTVTNGSRTVTSSGGTFTPAMIGRFFKLDREEEIYEILGVPTSTSLTLKETYIRDAGSGLSYLIWKRYYALPPDVHYNSGIELWKFPYRSQPIPKLEMNSIFKQS